MVFLKSLSHNLSPKKDQEISTLGQKIKAEEVMFCYDCQSILDESYGAVLKAETHNKGFSYISDVDTLLSLLNSLYWFRKFGEPSYKLSSIIRTAVAKRGIYFVKESLKQSLHTLNGFILKKFYAFGPEIVRYRQLAEQTARLFRDFFIEYTMSDGESFPPYMPNGIYHEAKEFFNSMKMKFHRATPEKRREAIEFDFSNGSLKAFFRTEMLRLQALITAEAISGRDYTDSLAYFFRMTEACQTRVMGYVPSYYATSNSQKFHEKVTRPLESPTKQELNLIYAGVQVTLGESGVPRNILTNSEDNVDLRTLRSCLQDISLDISLSSSVDHSYSEAGKLEDARLLFRKIKERNWLIPIKDLHDGSIIEYLPPLLDFDDESVNLSRYLFWTCFQLSLNYWCY